MARTPENPFRTSWLLARSHGIPKDVWAKALGVSRHMADDLTAGRRRGSLGQIASLNSRQRSWLVRYKDEQGGHHGFYTGRGKTLDQLIASGAIEGISAQQADEAEYAAPDGVISIQPKYPRFPSKVRIYATKPGGIHSWQRR